ncbi:glycosyltransferase family 39 protein [Rhodanobacter sp. AS-Z3]|uniref:ArnT family glycosyltransferase n=1 Tax=Rhodanobacter sp. AS-Z3 TaxID=3031330 RepID=UPI00247844E5|nr:glycosyltransferase family 39 protein [Rhodanobacter sp. AS-Z3]WEN16806.1 glycosyltransferase family 39 protein [Rhodanobacter sp. AS-Z3]
MPLYSTRTLAVAWDMWCHGHWLVPHINGEPYSEKAPLLFWMIQAGWWAFGVSDVWPRVLEVLFGGTQLVLISLLARRLFPDRPWMAKAAAWMLLAFGFAFLFGLQIMYDVLLATWVLAALLCLTPKPQRAEPRWLLFGLCIGFGLLTKGPVMLLHIVFPWLLGPLWNDWARLHRGRWYGRGVLAVLLGGAMLLAWALPAGFAGGEAYRQRLFFTQTAGRVVDKLAEGKNLQNHAEPFWFYLLWLPGMLFPFTGWPRMWVAVASLRRPLESGLRFALCWLLPTFIVLSLISGKQPYYPLPELGGMALLMAAAIALLRERQPLLASNSWLGTWPLAAGSFVAAVALFVLPQLAASQHFHGALGAWLAVAAPYSRYFSVVFLLLGALVLLRGRGELRRLAVAGLIGVLAINTLITLTIWPRYDVRPTSQLLGAADQAGRAIAFLGNYEGQFHFEGRLTRPIKELFGNPVVQDQEILAFSRAHPDGLIVRRVDQTDANALRYALLVQPFRSSWLEVWPAVALADLRSGQTPPEPAQPTRVYPADGRRTQSQP